MTMETNNGVQISHPGSRSTSSSGVCVLSEGVCLFRIDWEYLAEFWQKFKERQIVCAFMRIVPLLERGSNCYILHETNKAI